MDYTLDQNGISQTISQIASFIDLEQDFRNEMNGDSNAIRRR